VIRRQLLTSAALVVLLTACTEAAPEPDPGPDDTTTTISRVTCHFRYGLPQNPSKTTKQLSVSIDPAPAREQSSARLGPYVLLLNYVDDGPGPGGLSVVVRLRGERPYIVNDFFQLDRPMNFARQYVDDPGSRAILERTCSAS
jgi:hypothetical protein